MILQWNLGSRTNFPKKKSRATNGVSSNEHASRQQRLATSWEYRRESVSCCVTFAQYTSLLEFAVLSLEFHCVLWFFNILLDKTSMGKSVSVYEHFGWRTASRNELKSWTVVQLYLYNKIELCRLLLSLLFKVTIGTTGWNTSSY
jgi:hypothetical protein